MKWFHKNDVIMSAMASQITSLSIVYSSVYLGADQRKHQSSSSLAFMWEVTGDRKMFSFDDVIMSHAKYSGPNNGGDKIWRKFAVSLEECTVLAMVWRSLSGWFTLQIPYAKSQPKFHPWRQGKHDWNQGGMYTKIYHILKCVVQLIFIWMFCSFVGN